MPGKVVAIFIAGGEGRPMRGVINVSAITGLGLDGDRYATGCGAFQKPGAKEKIRHVTLIEDEAIRAANTELNQSFDWAETRRNIVVRDFPLNGLIGKRIMIGNSVIARVHELCDPCQRPGKLAGKSGFEQAFANRGGVRGEILTGGVIGLGYSVVGLED